MGVSNVFDENTLIKLMVVGTPSTLATLNLHLFVAKLKSRKGAFILFLGLSTIVGISFIIYFFLPDKIDQLENRYIFYIVSSLLVSFHSLIFFSGLSLNTTNEKVVSFAIVNFYNFLGSLLSSLLFCTALALAILGIDNLFGTRLGRNDAYQYLFIWGMGLFLTFRYLFNFPKLPYLKEDIKPHTTTNAFLLNYIGIPVIITYGLILFVYGIKIVFVENTFVTWLSVLMSIYFSFGTLVYLLNLGNTDQNTLAKSYHQYWPVASTPILILFIYDCCQTYLIEGVYVTNYVVFLFCTMAIVTLVYFIGFPKKSLQLLPLTIIVLSLLSVVSGPLNLWNSTKQNQQSRLVTALERSGNIVEGKVQLPIKQLESEKNLTKTINYLRDNGGLQFLKNYDPNGLLPQDLNTIILIENDYPSPQKPNEINYYRNNIPSIPYGGEGHIIPIVQVGPQKPIGYFVTFTQFNDVILLNDGSDILARFSFSFDNYDVQNQKINFEDQQYILTLYTKSLSGQTVEEQSKINFMEGIGVLQLK